MLILGIETSCDETSAAVVHAEKSSPYLRILSNISATSLALHAKTGGIIPEIAAREQLTCIIPVIKQALHEAEKTQQDIDAIAVTYGPGLIGSLLVGVETAKTLAYVWKKPIIPVNHLFGHIYANWLTTNEHMHYSISFPAIALIVSGGHTDLILMKDHNEYQWLGGTRDDAAGEAIDKIGRELNFPYPAGPAFEKAAAQGNTKAYQFPRPVMHDGKYDFSFSGLKTAAIREIIKLKIPLSEQSIANLARGVQDAIISVLVYKTLKAAEEYGVQSILLGGGVAANETLRTAFREAIDKKHLSIDFFAPEKMLCTDNAAMIAAAAWHMNQPVSWQEITANPELYFD